MTDARLHSISIQHFKAFREFQLTLEGRHLLAYGANGSGKSSLYWAIHAFLESANKDTVDVQKYFEPTNTRSLVNIHTPSPDNETANIQFAIDDNGSKSVYEISQNEHQTKKVPIILKASLASDFLTYRFLYDFSHARFVDIWPLFEKDILPFCVTTSGETNSPQAVWNRIKSGNANPLKYRGYAGANAYESFANNTTKFANILAEVVDSISTKAQEFYDKYFSAADACKLDLKLGIKTPPLYHRAGKTFQKPVLGFAIQVDGKTIPEPQIFLNEAKLSQLALSIRLAASLVNLQESDLKLLVIDDLLLSLDLSNRMKVVEILLSETFGNYQKIILTHDLGLFHEFRRMLGAEHSQWCFKKLKGNSREGVSINEQKSSIEKAEDYLKNFDLEEAAICLRKAAEDSAQRFRKVALNQIPPPGEFHSLTEDLRAARNNLRSQIPVKMYEKILKSVPAEHRDKLIRVTDDDIDSDASLDEKTKGILKCQRKKMSTFLNDSGWEHLQTIEIMDSILKMTDRVLNPANHWGESAVYHAELQKALTLINRLEHCLGL